MQLNLFGEKESNQVAICKPLKEGSLPI